MRDKQMQINGVIIGYDPGGNGKNGVAILEVQSSLPRSVEILTSDNAESVINKISTYSNLIGLGVDTLSCWSTGHSGWRPADLWLRKKYPPVSNSVMSPNTLSGSMGLNGMSVLIEISKCKKTTVLSETHPKVLWFALMDEKYDYDNHSAQMDSYLSEQLGLPIKTQNDHEWDAVISAYALLMGITNKWTLDLHTLPTSNKERIVTPCGKTHYFWPGQL
ncbi:hypothetical protein KKC22_20530 [Myxococcota bacterium]|nr:hypothetical protein [Myxococcota bacterium]